MSDSNRVALVFLEEVSWGVNPGTAPDEFRYTSESLGQSTTTVTSEEVRSDRQIAAVARTAVEANGDVNFELSYDNYDAVVYEGGLYSTFSADLGIGPVAIDADNGTNRFEDPITAGTMFANVSVGQWVKTDGFTDPANNDFFLVTDKDGVGPDDWIEVFADKSLVTESGSGDETVSGQMIRNGTTLKSYSAEKQFLDITQFLEFNGLRVNSWTLNIAAGALRNGTVSFLGKNANALAATTSMAAVTAANSLDPLNAIDNVVDCFENDASIAATQDLLSVSFTVNNNARSQPAIKTLGNIGIGIGSVGVTGAMSMYFVDETHYDKYINFTTTSLAFLTTDAAGNSTIYTFPRVKFTDSQVVVGGRDQDVTAEFTWEAFRDADTDSTIQIDKFDAP
jgi:hypothetical protein